MFTRRFTRRFGRLRGKLVLSYTVTSVVTFLIVEVLVAGGVLLGVGLNIPNIIISDLNKEALQAASFFAHGKADSEVLTDWLRVITGNMQDKESVSAYNAVFLSVVDTQGRVLGSGGSDPVATGTPIWEEISPQSRANLEAVLHDVRGLISKAGTEADGTVVAVVPIMRDGSTQGALIMKTAKPDRLQLLPDFVIVVIISIVIVTVIAIFAGVVSGYLTARGLTSRLKKLSSVADRWSRGDFHILAHDASEDELGEMARQLNSMAVQLQNLLQARQELATLEERNRLARDLHDSVKQQIFAVVMQIGAIKLLFRRDVDAAEVRLNEMERLVRQAQQELTSLIRELRPVALEGKGLAMALREMATQWAQQTDIVANVRIEGTQTLALTVEEGLYRIAQEVLANVARHSKATLVQITLMITDEIVTLSVIDNGQGFDTTSQGRMGVGLYSMRERIKALGGTIQLESTPGKGTRIIASCKRSSAVSSEVLTVASELT